MKKGFTVIELAIVVAIIGILSAVAVPWFNQKRHGKYSAPEEKMIQQKDACSYCVEQINLRGR